MPWFARMWKKWFAPPPVAALDEAAWRSLAADWPLLGRLPAQDADALRAMAGDFLQVKFIDGVQGLAVDDAMKWTVAVQACLPVLRLGLAWYDDWSNLFLTPAGFADTRRRAGPDGLLEEYDDELSGQVLELGPVLLSWDDVLQAGSGAGYNVVVHEMAHKLDARNGQDLDGMPPLPRERARAWRLAMGAAFADFRTMVDAAGRGTRAMARARAARLPLDEYAADDAAEFFAVACETFFERPWRIRRAWPDCYACLADFFGQDPAAWP